MLKVVADGMLAGEPKADFEKRVAEDRWQRLRGEKLHGKFFNDIKDIAHEKSWQWMRGGFVDKRTEGFVCAAQENVLPTRLYCATVIKDGDGQKCRKCGEEAESVGHLVSHCKQLRQTEFKRRHDKMGLRVYWEVCGRHGLKRTEKWYEETPDPVRKSADGRYEVWWDQKVNIPTAFEANRPDLVVIDHEDEKWILVDFSVPFDRNVVAKEEEKIAKYKDLAAEVCRMNSVKVEVVPIVVGALGVVTKDLVGWLKRIGLDDVIGCLQTSAIIGTSAKGISYYHMMLVGFMVVEDSWWAAGTVHHWDSCNTSTCMIPRSSVFGQRPVLGLITPGSEYDLLPRSFLLGIWFTYYYYYLLTFQIVH